MEFLTVCGYLKGIFGTLRWSNGVVLTELYFLVYDYKVCRTVMYCLKLLPGKIKY